LDSVLHFYIRLSRNLGIEGDDAAVVAEFAGSGVAIGTGCSYDQAFLVYMRTKSGKIVLLWEHFDPSGVAAVFIP
jgi:ketosteroid isomerase-like protein